MKKTIKCLTQVVSEIQNLAYGKDIVFVSGNFNVIHPGHLRYLNYAANNGDFLVVGVTRDGGPSSYVPEDLRLEGIKNLSIVDYSFLLPESLEQCLTKLKPNVVIKGKEFENLYNIEKDIVASYGGKLAFSSGEVRFSSMDLLQKELSEINAATIRKPADFPLRHSFTNQSLLKLISSFHSIKVIIVGDLIIDEYITCDPLGMSQEDPTIVITPIRTDKFIGGAGVVAAHARGLGAKVHYYGVIGDDETATFAIDTINKYGIGANLFVDDYRKTTLKQRYRCQGKTLLRVSHLDQHEINQEIADRIIISLEEDLKDANLLVFSDFNYGCLSQYLIKKIINICKEYNVPMAADSQSSSQVGDISRYDGMLLVTPTEHEVRLAIRDKDLGLAALPNALRRKCNVKNILITLGSEGLIVDTDSCEDENFATDQLPAFNIAPKDVAGAGDSLLISAAMALVSGASIWESAYIGSVAAACQVGRVGNFPLTIDEIIKELA